MTRFSFAELNAATKFIRESNKIEGILRCPLKEEIDEHLRFMKLAKVTLDDLVQFVGVFQPNAKLRDRKGLNVYIGNHVPLAGGPQVIVELEKILKNINEYTKTAFENHLDYEYLHPFTDGNGRSGRMLWLWQMYKAPLGFLHTFYYQTLENSEIGRLKDKHHELVVKTFMDLSVKKEDEADRKIDKKLAQTRSNFRKEDYDD